MKNFFIKFFIIIFFALLNCNLAWAGQNLLVKTIANQTFDLTKENGKVVIVFFWASWCSVCQKEIIQLDDLYKKYHQQGLEIIGLNIDGDVESAQNISYQIAINDLVEVNDFDNPRTMPTIYVIDKQGKIYTKLYQPEEIKINHIEEIVQTLLK